MSAARISKRHLNKVVLVEFDDHVQGAEAPVQCRVFGRVKSFDSKQAVLRYWEALCAESATGFDNDNEEVLTLLQSAITSVKVLR
jgi:hypothetical protein